ncbi:MAG: hypothetical protein K6E73_11715 [Bacteroidales bacterium]|jgi:hypothetical protein|nr:hypothetical protein [Bacteroidales bacterium]MCR5362657.1 hypothetical protein [Bacteroidales bacterium]
MTYSDFTNIFLPKLACAYRDGQIKFHALVDFDLWKKIFPDESHGNFDVQWSAISFNAYVLNDEEKSLLIVFSIPLFKIKREAKFVAFRLDNKRKRIVCYYLRRPQYHDDYWKIYLYDMKMRKEYFITDLSDTDSMRVFIKDITDLPFRENATIMEKLATTINS